VQTVRGREECVRKRRVAETRVKGRHIVRRDRAACMREREREREREKRMAKTVMKERHVIVRGRAACVRERRVAETHMRERYMA